jgi:hypothetical protein
MTTIAHSEDGHSARLRDGRLRWKLTVGDTRRLGALSLTSDWRTVRTWLLAVQNCPGDYGEAAWSAPLHTYAPIASFERIQTSSPKYLIVDMFFCFTSSLISPALCRTKSPHRVQTERLRHWVVYCVTSAGSRGEWPELPSATLLPALGHSDSHTNQLWLSHPHRNLEKYRFTHLELSRAVTSTSFNHQVNPVTSTISR